MYTWNCVYFIAAIKIIWVNLVITFKAFRVRIDAQIYTNMRTYFVAESLFIWKPPNKKSLNSSGRISLIASSKEWLSRLFRNNKVYQWNKCCQVINFNDEEKMCIDKMSNFSSLISSVFFIGFLSILNPYFVTTVEGKN